MDEAGVEVREARARVERERGAEFFERAGRVVLLVKGAAEQDVNLRAVVAERHHLPRDALGLLLPPNLPEREGEWVVERGLARLGRDDLGEQRGGFGVIFGHE